MPKSRYYELRVNDGELMLLDSGVPFGVVFSAIWGREAQISSARRSTRQKLTAVLKFGTSAREYVLLHEDAGK